MYTRILVPLDGSAHSQALMSPAFARFCSKPSFVSSLVDGLETEVQTDLNAIPDGVKWKGIYRFSLNGEYPTAEFLMAL